MLNKISFQNLDSDPKKAFLSLYERANDILAEDITIDQKTQRSIDGRGDDYYSGVYRPQKTTFQL